MARTMATSTIYEKKTIFWLLLGLKPSYDRLLNECVTYIYFVSKSHDTPLPLPNATTIHKVFTQKYPPDILYFTIVTCFLFKTKNRNCDISKFGEVSIHLFCIEISWYSSFPSQRDHHTQCLDKNIHLK